MPTFSIGIDFGTESARALLVELGTGQEVAAAICPYPSGVIDAALPLPDAPVRLAPDWALQDPDDYLHALRQTIPALLRRTGIDPGQVVGIGVDFTSCTMLPVTGDGTPLCRLPAYRHRPHAWVKLWKHHAAQPQADRMNALARQRGEPWLPRYGGRISSEWFFPKVLQMLEEDPEVYAAADRLLEAADWIVWQLTGEERPSACTAGYKACWSKREGFPGSDFFGALDPRLAPVVGEKVVPAVQGVGERAGALSPRAAAWTGLRPGTAVAVALIDAHAAVPAATVTEPGRMVLIMGTSICQMVLGAHLQAIEGIAGVVEDGIVPGLFGYEAGQPSLGDTFAWCVRTLTPPGTGEQAADPYGALERAAAALRPGETGLLALDWWNGNRSLLDDADLTGLLVGATVATKAPEVYRALMEAAAFGTRVIIDAFVENGVPVHELVACGGLAARSDLLLQIYADVTGRILRRAATDQASALGAAMYGAVAAGRARGGYDTIQEAAQHMARLREEAFRPVPEHERVYDRLYAAYRHLYDYFGRSSLMKTLKGLRAEALRAAAAGPAPEGGPR